MKFLKYFKINESKSNDIEHILNMLISNMQIFELPYSYYGDPKINSDFNIYIIYGYRLEFDDHEFLKELYMNHDILNSIYNLEFHSIALSKDEVIITIRDYKNGKYDRDLGHYLRDIPETFLRKYLPTSIFDKIKKYISSYSTGAAKGLHRGIDYSDGSGSNLSLFDWKYKSK